MRHSGSALPDNNDDSDFDELNFNPSQRSTNSDTESEQHEPPQKSICTSPHPNCPSLHDRDDIASAGGNHFTGSSSDSEDDVSDNSSFREGLADWTNKFSINLLTSEDELTRFLKMFYYRRWMSILLVIHIKKN